MLNIIAYITTGVVSGLDAIVYLETALLPSMDANFNKQSATIDHLAFFCLITNLGMKESATFEKVIFVMHVFTLSLLTLLSLISFLVLTVQEIMDHKAIVLARTAYVLGKWIQSDILYLPNEAYGDFE